MAEDQTLRTGSRKRKPVNFYEAVPAAFRTPGDFAVFTGPPRANSAKSKSVSDVQDADIDGRRVKVRFPSSAV